LGESLKDVLSKQERSNLLVLGIPRGGLVTADIVARKLGAPLDIIIPRKLTDMDNKEHAIGAVMEDGTTFLDEETVKLLSITQEYIEKEKAYQIEEIRRRKSLYGKSSTNYNFEDKIVILVDDGAATGATIIVAARWIRNQPSKPNKLIIALPVTSRDTATRLEKECDKLEVITKPSAGFRAVAQYYQDFGEITDEQVVQTLRNRRGPT
jgi:putative phosphoribosyl transferase